MSRWNDAAVVIPARLESSRLPRKLLLRTGSGEALLARTYKQAAEYFDVFVAIDDLSLANALYNVCPSDRIVMTGLHNNGTERVVEAAEKLGLYDRYKFIINWQADEPELCGKEVCSLVQSMRARTKWQTVGTLVTPLLHDDAQSSSVVKAAVGDKTSEDFRPIFYFSRAPLLGGCRHIGLYVFVSTFLEFIGRYSTETRLSRAEKLEQLMWLELGALFVGREIDHPHKSIDTKEDWENFLNRDKRSCGPELS